MTNLGEKLTEEEIEELFRETSLEKEEHFNYEEFIKIILMQWGRENDRSIYE